MEWHFERVAGPYGFTEGPVWNGEAVLFSDIPNSRILRYDPRTGECDEYRTRTNRANGLVLAPDGGVYVCETEGRRISHYGIDGDSRIVAEAFEGNRLNSPNDIVLDGEGRLWFTDPRYSAERADMELDHESVYRLAHRSDDTWAISRMTFDTTRPNGLIVTPDGTTLYVAQSEYGEDRKRELRAYPIEEKGGLGEHSVLHNFYPHRGIDGMTLDSDLNIVATAGWEKSGPGPMVYVFTPSGRVLETHPMPVSPTNCTFGDNDLCSLYVTAADGSLYRARTHRRGLP